MLLILRQLAARRWPTALLLTPVALWLTPLQAQQPVPPAATAVIHAERPGATIDRHIYGQFAEHLGRGIYEGIWVGEHSPIPNTRGFRNDVLAALRDLHVPVVRWPGGCFADEYHWRDGIGPRARRRVTLNTNWGGVPETNEFGTHEFLDFAELIGADAYINGNLGTGSSAEMAEWLQYMTSDRPTALTAERARNGHPGPWKIAYFAVGNEAWGCGGNMTPDNYVELFRQTATFLKAPEGARPLIIASGGHDDDTSWTGALRSRVPAPDPRRDQLSLLHDPRRDLEEQGAGHRLCRGSMDFDPGAHAENGGVHHPQQRRAGQIRSGEEDRLCGR